MVKPLFNLTWIASTPPFPPLFPTGGTKTKPRGVIQPRVKIPLVLASRKDLGNEVTKKLLEKLGNNSGAPAPQQEPRGLYSNRFGQIWADFPLHEGI